jgi:uncharacterized protein
MRTITLEEHYATRAFMEGAGRQLGVGDKPAGRPPRSGGRYGGPLIDQLCDLGEGRIAAMDEAGIDVQVLSLTAPGVEQLDAPDAVKLAREMNDFLALAVERNPSRFGGFAALPTQAPETAAEELERCVRELRFKGALINGHTRGRYLDDSFFWPILERAEALNVPIYLHPTRPPKPVVDVYYSGNFPPGVAQLLSIAGWGWHIETALHVIRVILGGVFDEYPDLQLVVGHLGETLPFMLPRLDATLSTELTKLDFKPGDYLRRNVHYTFSGFNFAATFLDLLLEVGIDRIMFSADYPYASMAEARSFLDRLPVSPADRERIAHGNAERLFHI